MHKELFNKKTNTSVNTLSWQDKLEKLRCRWKDRDDTSGKILAFHIINQCKIPGSLMQAIVQDSSETFDTAYKATDIQKPLSYYFDAACICGSTNIVKHLIEKYNFNIALSEDLIAYALSSGDFNLAQYLANLVIASGRTSPGNIYLYNSCEYSQLTAIANLFASLNENHPPSP